MSLSVGEALELLAREVKVITPPVAIPTGLRYASSAVILPNGWWVSVGFGTRHHCANYGPDDPTLALGASPDCEVAICRPDGSWFEPHCRRTWDEMPARDLLDIVDAVATIRDGGPCPCPDCVRARRKARAA